jgi:hypothetical protein
MQQPLKDLIKNLSVALLDEFDRNFEQKSFFYQPWPDMPVD